jgi:hypothetical protein
MDVIEVMNQCGNSLGPAAAIYEEGVLLYRSVTETVFFHSHRKATTSHTLATHAERSMPLYGTMILLISLLVCWRMMYVVTFLRNKKKVYSFRICVGVGLEVKYLCLQSSYLWAICY